MGQVGCVSLFLGVCWCNLMCPLKFWRLHLQKREGLGPKLTKTNLNMMLSETLASQFSLSGFRVQYQKTLTWTCESEYLSIPFYFLFSENSHDSWAWVFTRPYSMRSFCPWRSAVKPAIDKLVGWSREGLWSSYQGLVTTSYWSMVGLRSVDPNWGWTDTPKPFGNGLLSKRPTEFRGP